MVLGFWFVYFFLSFASSAVFVREGWICFVRELLDSWRFRLLPGRWS